MTDECVLVTGTLAAAISEASAFHGRVLGCKVDEHWTDAMSSTRADNV